MAATDAVDGQGWANAYFIALTIVTFLLCLARAASRFQRGAVGFDFDDYFNALSWLASLSITILTAVGIFHFNFDRHLSDIGPALITGAVEFGWILNVVYQIQTALVKVSILLFYRRLAPSSYSQRFKFAVWIMIVAIAVQFLVVFILYLTQCIPLNAIWLSFDHNWASDNRYFCAPQSQFSATAWFAGIVGVVTDVITALLPPWLFVQIRLPRRARIGLSIIFAFGVLITIPSVLRLVYLVQAARPEADRTWLTMKALIAGKTEGDVAIICASIPSLHIFFRRFFHSGEPDRVSDSRLSSRHGNRSQPSLRRNPSRTSSRSARSVRFDQHAPEAGYDLKPHPHAPQVLKWSEKSFDDIPEAYADNVGTLTSAETDAESSVNAQDYGVKPLPPHQRPETAQSWLNIGPDSSDDEEEGVSSTNRGKLPKSYPKR